MVSPAIRPVVLQPQPNWLRSLDRAVPLLAYYEVHPTPFGDQELAVEVHFMDLSVDRFFNHPLTGRHTETFAARLDDLVGDLPRASRLAWAPFRTLAQRTAALPATTRELLASAWVNFETRGQTRRQPAVFYALSLPRTLPAAERVCSAPIEALCRALLGDADAEASIATLAAAAAHARPSHRAAYLGVQFDRGPRLTPYIVGQLGDHLAMCNELAVDDEMRAFLEHLEDFDPWHDRELLLSLELEHGKVTRLELELYFEKEDQRHRHVAEELFTSPAICTAHDAVRLSSLKGLMRKGAQAVHRDGYVVAHTYPSHLKVTKARGRAMQWKFYQCFAAIRVR